MAGRWVVLVAVVSLLGFGELVPHISAEGCFWISKCQNRWMGGCGNEGVPVDMSNDCQGLCAEPQYPVCSPFFTRFQCCSEGTARESTGCASCPNKVDVGDGWLCCSDCSDPQVTNIETKTGFCQTADAHLSFQSKPREVFKWSSSKWRKCSGPCKGGVRKRDVKCLRYIKNAPHLPSVANENQCLAATMPAWEEPCTPEGCVGHSKRGGFPVWAIVLISLTSVAAAGGLAFAGFVIYKRRTENTNHGFVYVMLEGY